MDIDFWEIYDKIFIDNFLLSTLVCFAALGALLTKRYSRPGLPYQLVIGCWSLLVVGGAIVLTAIVHEWMTVEHSMAGAAVLVATLAGTPLMLCGAVSLFFFPRR
jgi:hypothetical protein